MSDTRKPNRIIVPHQRSPDGTITSIARVHTVSGILDRALGIVDEQLIKLSIKSRSATFEERDAKVLQAFVRSLVDLSKEEREREKVDKTSEDLKDLTNDELLALAEAKLATVKEANKPTS